ncbi:MAG: hypothetical protein NVV72_01190 [Asticcacaulis sp.]|nr:hypothetical protein [Asticcacaulis sp.]
MKTKNWALVLPMAAALSNCSPATTPAETKENSSISATVALSAIPDTKEVTTLDLLNYARSMLSFKKPDEFSKSFNDTALAGKNFDFHLAVNKRGDEGSINYGYDADREILTLLVLPEAGTIHRGDHDTDLDFNYIVTTHETILGKPGPMTNAYGVTKNVTPSYEFMVGVGSASGEYMGALPHTEVTADRKFVMYDIASKELKLTPEQARTVVSEMWAEVSGTFKPSEDGKILTCKESSKDATINYPYEEHWTQCVYSARISHVRIVSKAFGVLAEWPETGKDALTGKYLRN